MQLQARAGEEGRPVEPIERVEQLHLQRAGTAGAFRGALAPSPIRVMPCREARNGSGSTARQAPMIAVAVQPSPVTRGIMG